MLGQLGLLPTEKALLTVDAQDLVTGAGRVLQRHLGFIIELIQPLGPLGITGHGKRVGVGTGEGILIPCL